MLIIRGCQKIKRMMKKEYIKPEVVVEILLPETMLALSMMGSNETPGGDDDFNANRLRGDWDDLW